MGMPSGDQGPTFEQPPVGGSKTSVYPNPSSSREWTDRSGTVWHRRGDRGEALDSKRTRRLMRRDGLPLVTWKYGSVSWHWSAEEKTKAAAALREGAGSLGEIFPTEWKAEDGTHMLMLEHR